jgi:hypothetical protein
LRNPVAVEDFDADGDGDLAVPCGDAVCLLLGRLAEASSDLDQDRVPDECQRPREEPFRRGDANGDGAASLTDAIVILNRLFAGGAALACPRAADADDDGSVSLTDAVRVLAFLFRGDGAPAPPFPVCGTDPTPDALGDCRYPQGQCGP